MDMELMSRLSFYKDLSAMAQKDNITLVKHIETEQLYVKKVLSTYDVDVYRRLKQMQIPFVPKIYECTEDLGRLYVIEEYIQGMNLEKYIQMFGCLSEDVAVWIAESICSILSALHSMEKPIIHRDIKPTNIILKGDFAESPVIQSVYLIDFNTAREYDAGALRDTEAIGTKGFAAPEQYGFSQSDARTDIYALGVLLNYMLTGALLPEKMYDGRESIKYTISHATDISPESRLQNADEFKASLRGVRQRAEDKYDKSWQRFLPVGYRHLKFPNMLVATFYYAFCIILAVSIEVKDSSTGANIVGLEEVLYKITYVLAFAGLPFIWGNYLNFWRSVVLLRSEKLVFRMAGVIAFSIVWMFLVLLIFLITDVFLFK